MFFSGIYQIDPALLTTDATGYGPQSTKLGLVFGKIHLIKDYIWINTRTSLGDFFFLDVQLRGFKPYEGEYNSSRTVSRWGNIPLSFAAEISLTCNLTIAFTTLSLLFSA
jgi:hypothetical protein